MARRETTFWCEQCEDWTPCGWPEHSDYRFDTSSVGKFEYDDGSRIFRRPRVCSECNTLFFTIEIGEDVFDRRMKALKTVHRTLEKLKLK